MSLALVKITESEFDTIHTHLISRQPRYQNMHLREACQRSGVRELRYLHAMHFNGGAENEIEGVISGPDIFWHYKLSQGTHGTQLSVITDRASPKERARIGRQFLNEIMARIAEEKKAGDYHPRRKKGQYYLQRSVPGMSATHRYCQNAVKAGVLSQNFVSRLEGWKLELLYP